MGAREKKSKKLSVTKAESLLEQTTFFMDYCLGRRVVEALRAGGLRVEAHLDHFRPDAADATWIPAVAERGWVILSKDKGIRRRRVELEQFRMANARMLTLSSGNLTAMEMVEIILNNRVRIARHLYKSSAPSAAVILRHAVQPIALD